MTDSIYGYIFKETQNMNLKGYMHPYFHCSVIYNSQDMEETQAPINRRVYKKGGGTNIQKNITQPYKE